MLRQTRTLAPGSSNNSMDPFRRGADLLRFHGQRIANKFFVSILVYLAKVTTGTHSDLTPSRITTTVSAFEYTDQFTATQSTAKHTFSDARRPAAGNYTSLVNNSGYQSSFHQHIAVASVFKMFFGKKARAASTSTSRISVLSTSA